MNLILRSLVLVASVFVASRIIPGVEIDSNEALFIVAILIGVINAFVKPILVLLTLPLTIVTLGIFLLILNGLLVLGLSAIVPGFTVVGLFAAILFSIVVSVISSVLNNLI